MPFLHIKGTKWTDKISNIRNKLGLSLAKLSSSCVKLIRSYDMLSCLNLQFAYKS